MEGRRFQFVYHLERVRSVTGVEKTVSGVVADREARSEVGPENWFIIRSVDIFILLLNITDSNPVTLGWTRNIAVHQLIHLLTMIDNDWNSEVSC